MNLQRAKLLHDSGFRFAMIDVGTAIGKLVGTKREVVDIADMLRSSLVEPGTMLEQDWGTIKTVIFS